MKIYKGQFLKIDHLRKGIFTGWAAEDFDTETSEFYPIILVSEQVTGMSEDWMSGERIPCRKSMCKIELSQGVE